ncbi:acyltransferase [Sphingomonas jatrophae]|uniref:acyltransferase n=1 Tax=Sphingomonas jatrophae TaxID=1166337 RepID=UPI0013F4CC5B|nr:acyltransferase [Sphingomonas jatrophae]
MGDKADKRSARGLIAAGLRRTRFAWWRARAGLRRRVILLSYPGISCGPGVSIDPSAKLAAHDGGTIEIGAGCEIGARTTIVSDGGAIRLGRDCFVGAGSTIHAKASIDIGADTMIADNVAIRDHDHATADPARAYRLQGFVTAPVRIGRNVWLATKVTVLKGATLGDGAVIGANAVVSGEIPEGMIAVGIPARPIRRAQS